MITRVDNLNSFKHLWGAIARLQDDIPFSEDLQLLAEYASRGARVVLIFDDNLIVASYLYIPCNSMRLTKEMKEILDKEGVDPGQASVATHIYVKSTHRGQGLSKVLYNARVNDSWSQGIFYGFDFEHRTNTIRSWTSKICDMKDTDALDSKGNTIRLVTLKEVK